MLFVLTFGFSHFADGFSVRDARIFQNRFAVEFGFEFFANYVKLSVPEAAQNHFVGFRIFGYGECDVFVLKFGQSAEHLVFALLGGVYGAAVNGTRQHHFHKLNFAAFYKHVAR